MGVSISGLGHELPPLKRVGGKDRAIVASATGSSTLAMAAVDPVFAECGWTADDVEMIVFATMTPNVTFPGAGCFLQQELGGGTVGAMDIRGQCAGFLMGLAASNDLIEVGKYQRVLLAAAEVHSSGLDYSDAGIEVAALYGDAGSAVALGRGPGIARLGSIVCGADGSHHERFWCEFPSSRRYPTRITMEDVEAGGHYLRIDRDHVSQFGRDKLPEVIGQVLAADQVSADDIDLFILSHVFPEVAEDAGGALSIPAERLLVAGAEYGHLTAASLPVALDQARRAGRVGRGARVCLATCGAGYAWGAALINFS